MKMFKITQSQANALTDDRTKHYGARFNPVQDVNGDWFISEPEANYCILHFSFDPVEAEYIAPEPDPLDL
jgi:hypothetical protein